MVAYQRENTDVNMELNIGLTVNRPDADNTSAAVCRRAAKTIDFLAGTLTFARVFGRMVQSDYPDPKTGEPVEEWVLVVKTVRRGSAPAVRAHLGALARLLEQDAIAVLDADRGEGWMVGPEAAEWTFDVDYFTRYEVASATDRAPLGGSPREQVAA